MHQQISSTIYIFVTATRTTKSSSKQQAASDISRCLVSGVNKKRTTDDRSQQALKGLFNG
jgi:hypothetical protein